MQNKLYTMVGKEEEKKKKKKTPTAPQGPGRY